MEYYTIPEENKAALLFWYIFFLPEMIFLPQISTWLTCSNDILSVRMSLAILYNSNLFPSQMHSLSPFSCCSIFNHPAHCHCLFTVCPPPEERRSLRAETVWSTALNPGGLDTSTWHLVSKVLSEWCIDDGWMDGWVDDDGWMDKNAVYISTNEHDVALKRKEILMYRTLWMNLGTLCQVK